MDLLRRLHSFINWPPESVSPVVLANAGFKYTGYGDKVMCPVCGLEIEGWPNNRLLHPKNEHRMRSPECSWVSSEASESSGSVTVTPAQASYLRQLTENNPSASVTVGLASIVNCAPSPSVNNHATTAIGDNSSTMFNTRTLLESTVVGASNRDEILVTRKQTTKVPINRTLPDLNQLKVERTRLDTYFDWPETAPIQPPDLARTGLFYTGSHDRVRCVYCGGVLHHWTKDDIPASEHHRHFPECPFIRGLDVGNVPLDNEKISANEELHTTHKTVDALPLKNTSSFNQEYDMSCYARPDELVTILNSTSGSANGFSAARCEIQNQGYAHRKRSSEERHHKDEGKRNLASCACRLVSPHHFNGYVCAPHV